MTHMSSQIPKMPKGLPNKTKRGLLMFVAASLNACASLYPVQPWNSRKELIDEGTKHQLTPVTVEDARNLVIGLYVILAKAKNERDLQALIGEEVSFYGTLLAVVGITVNSRAARNTGGVVAGLAALLTGHYKPGDQSLIFDKATQRVDCLRDLMRPITKEARALFTTNFGGDTDLANAYVRIPSDTLDFVDTVSKDLNAALKSVTLSSPSKDDLATTMANWKQSKEAGSKPDVQPMVANGLAVRNWLAADAAAQKAIHDEMQSFADAVKDYHTDGAACLVQHTQ